MTGVQTCALPIFQDMLQFVDADIPPPPPPPSYTPIPEFISTKNDVKQEENNGFFDNMFKKFKRAIGRPGQQNEGKIIRMSESQLRNFIRKELLK